MSRSVSQIPETPSQTINSKLQANFSTTPNNALQSALACAVCGFFSVATTIYAALTDNHSDRDVGQMWMAACSLVTAGLALSAWIAYSLIISLSFVFHGILYYAAVMVALLAIGLGVAGVVLYRQDRGSAGKVEKTTQRSTSDERKHE